MKLRSFMAITASALVIGANLFVISAKQGSVNSKTLLSKAFSFNHFAYANDPGFYDASYPTGESYPNGIADCSSIGIEEYSIDVKVNTNAGQTLMNYVQGGGSLSTSNIPYVNGNVSLSAGNNSNNSSNNNCDLKIVGILRVDVSTARPQYVYCDYRNHNMCYENTDPCNRLKEQYLKQALSTFGL